MDRIILHMRKWGGSPLYSIFELQRIKILWPFQNFPYVKLLCCLHWWSYFDDINQILAMLGLPLLLAKSFLTSTDLYYDFWIINNIMLLDWIFWMLIILFWHFWRKIFLINTSMVARSITLYSIFWTIRNETVAMLNWIPEFIKVEFPSAYQRRLYYGYKKSQKCIALYFAVKKMSLKMTSATSKV